MIILHRQPENVYKFRLAPWCIQSPPLMRDIMDQFDSWVFDPNDSNILIMIYLDETKARELVRFPVEKLYEKMHRFFRIHPEVCVEFRDKASDTTIVKYKGGRIVASN